MSYQLPVATALALTLVVGTIGSPAYAGPPFTQDGFLRISEFEGHIVFCAPANPPVSVEVLPGGVEIITFVNIGNIWVTGNPLVDGVAENRSVVTVVPDSPITTANLTGKIDVAAVDGRWRFRQRLTISPDGFSGIGLGLGFGDLRGKLLLFQTGDVEFIEDSPCDVPSGVPLSGKVISFGWIG